MEEETPALTFQAIFQRALEEFVAQRGGGFIEAYSGCAEFIDADGHRAMLMAQSAHLPYRILGLAEFQSEYIRDSIRDQLAYIKHHYEE